MSYILSVDTALPEHQVSQTKAQSAERRAHTDDRSAFCALRSGGSHSMLFPNNEHVSELALLRGVAA
jgi:hypothetical protein